MRSCNLMLCFAIYIGFIGAAIAQTNITCNPSMVHPVQNFSMDKISGKWFGIQLTTRRSDEVSPLPYRCLTDDIGECDSENCTYYFEQSFQDLEGDEIYTATSSVIPSPNTPAIWKMISQSDSAESDVVHVQTDYDTWGIQYVCNVIENQVYEIMVVSTRSRTPSQELIDILQSVVEGYGFPKENTMRIMQTNCLT